MGDLFCADLMCHASSKNFKSCISAVVDSGSPVLWWSRDAWQPQLVVVGEHTLTSIETYQLKTYLTHAAHAYGRIIWWAQGKEQFFCWACFPLECWKTLPSHDWLLQGNATAAVKCSMTWLQQSNCWTGPTLFCCGCFLFVFFFIWSSTVTKQTDFGVNEWEKLHFCHNTGFGLNVA